MIVRDKPGIADLLTAMRGSVLPHILRPLLGIIALAAVMVAADRRFGLLPHLDGTAFTVFGIGLSLFLGFRNNAAYDRWWEARKLWGGLLADLRSLAREAEVFVADDALRREMLRQSLGFLHAHRMNLRRLTADPAAPPETQAVLGTAHPPCAALDRLNALVAEGLRDGRIDGFGARGLTTRLGSIALQQAGCERIATSPLPFVYSLLIYRTTYLYCLLLPLVLAGGAGWMAPLFVGIVAYVFLGLAEVTEELSHPFAPTTNGLPLDAICRTAEISMAPHLGEAPPAPLKPVDYYLS
jgi:putative membrane protein